MATCRKYFPPWILEWPQVLQPTSVAPSLVELINPEVSRRKRSLLTTCERGGGEFVVYQSKIAAYLLVSLGNHFLPSLPLSSTRRALAMERL